MNMDISDILDGWDYQPHEILVRKIVGNDGKTKIQMRLDLGLFQMEWTDRPDGQRPFDKASLLDHYLTLIEKDKAEFGSEGFFTLSREDCENLQVESLQYYHRRLSFFELEAYEEAGLDAEHNLKIMEIIRLYAEDEHDKLSFEQFRPFVIMHRAKARGMLSTDQKNISEALRHIEEGIEEIEAFYKTYDRLDLIEESQELKVLRDWAEQIRDEQPRSPLEQLRDDLQEAIDNEEFERAAELRDKLKDYDV